MAGETCPVYFSFVNFKYTCKQNGIDSIDVRSLG
jgi:hypothetical protein